MKLKIAKFFEIHFNRRQNMGSNPDKQKTTVNGELRNRIENLLLYLNQNLYGKEEALRLTLLSAVAGESVLLLGPAGREKNTVCRRVAGAFSDFYECGKLKIENDGYFEYFMNESLLIKDICGPVDYVGTEHLTESYLPGAKIAFLDEIFESSPAVLNTLLTIINDRKYHNGNKLCDLPILFVAAGTSKTDPYKAAEEKKFETLRESFALHVSVRPLTNDKDFFEFADSPNVTLKPNMEQKALLLNTGEVKLWQSKINKVAIGDDVKKIISEIRRKCFDYYVSDTRWKKIIHILKTSAFLNGRDTVDLMDCSLIDYAVPYHFVEDILKQNHTRKFDSEQLAGYKANFFANREYYKFFKLPAEKTAK